MQKPLHYILLLLFLLNAPSLMAQREKNTSSKKLNKAAESLQKSLSEGDEIAIAENYEKLARELSEKGEYGKAEEYLKRANEIYTKLKRTDKKAPVTRGIARNQEAQMKTKEAVVSYQTAAKVSLDSSQELLNVNDIKRLTNADPAIQQQYAEKNIEILQEKRDRPETDKSEITDAYKNLAASQLKQKKPDDAVKSLEKALQNPVSSNAYNSITKKIVDIYKEEGDNSSAVSLLEAAANKEDNLEQKVTSLIELSELHASSGRRDAAETTLQQAYTAAINAGNTSLAKRAVSALATLYAQQQQTKKSLEAYQGFVNNLDSLIKKDSSLIDARLFEVTEERIKELENEKQLQAKLIDKQNLFNYVLGASVALLAVLLFFILRSRNAINSRNKKIALQSLRREMNPHFLFNSLNSVNQYIAENNEIEANRFLTSYSGLMRSVMEHSGKDFVPLHTEIDQLKKYLELEHQRFKDKFDYHISIDEAIDTDALLIPNMLIQPHLENAVWHGLRYKEGMGQLSLAFIASGTNIIIKITDDGIGLTKGAALKTGHQKSYQSRGLGNTKERISLLNELYKLGITMTMEERTGNNISGTVVEIEIPQILKQNVRFQN